jgi:hypothetical protein
MCAQAAPNTNLNLDPFGPASSVLVLDAVPGEALVVPGGAWLLRATFVHEGADLRLVGEDGTEVVVRDYFSLDTPPDLRTEGGSQISADLAMRLAGPQAPGQFAQVFGDGSFGETAFDVAQAVSEPIGQVETASGSITAVRVDGTQVTLGEGDTLFQGDVIETGAGAALGIVFVDDTTFAMGSDGRAVMDEFVFNADTGDGSFSMSLVQGAFTFVSGQIAKSGPDAMLVRTPVATIGVRGTHPIFGAAAEGEENTYSLLPTPNGPPGSIVITNLAGDPPVELATIGATLVLTSGFVPLPPPEIRTVEQIEQQFQNVVTTYTTVQSGQSGSNDDDDSDSGNGDDDGSQSGDGEGEEGAGEEGDGSEGDGTEGEGEGEEGEGEEEQLAQGEGEGEGEEGEGEEGAEGDGEGGDGEGGEGDGADGGDGDGGDPQLAAGGDGQPPDGPVPDGPAPDGPAPDGPVPDGPPGGNPFGGDPFGGDPLLSGNPFGNDPFGGDPLLGGSGDDPFGNDPFGNDPFGDDPFGDDPFGDDPFGDDPFGDDPFDDDDDDPQPDDPEEGSGATVDIAGLLANSGEFLTGITVDAASITFQGNSSPSAAPFTSVNLGTVDDTAFSLTNAGVLFTSGDGNPPTTNNQVEVSGFAGGAPLDSAVLSQTDPLVSPDALVDATVFTFLFTAAANVAAVVFEWMFGSEEFSDSDPESDIAAVFVDGVNYLTFQDGSAVKFVDGSNESFFTDNTNGELAIEYSGVTAPDVMVGLLNTGLSTHTLQIIVSDTDDFVVDSGLYLAPLVAPLAATVGATSGDDTLVGTTGNDVITDNLGADLLFGAAGDDNLSGGNDNDRLYGGLGNDSLSGGGGNDTLSGGGGADTLNGGSGDDVLVGGFGNDNISSGSGTDTIFGGLGNDTITVTGPVASIDGGLGTDSLTLSDTAAHTVSVRNVESITGGTNSDTVTLTSVLSGTTIDLGNSTDSLTLEAGGNTVSVANIETVSGGSGDDNITDTGSTTATTFDGRAGNDSISAGGGNDELIGGLGAGVDSLTGGAGSDTFSFLSASDSAPGSGDTITDFDATDDSEDINLNGFAAGGFVFLGNEAQAFSGGSNNSEARFNDTSKLLEIDSDGDGTADMEITLTGVALADLDANDFTDGGGGS